MTTSPSLDDVANLFVEVDALKAQVTGLQASDLELEKRLAAVEGAPPVITDPPPVEDPPADPGADSPDGTEIVAPTSDKIICGGIPYFIYPDTTVGVGDLVSAKSGNVQKLKKVKNPDGPGSRVEQFAKWADGEPQYSQGVYTVPADGSQGEKVSIYDFSDEIAVPPPVSGGDLPDGFSSFTGWVVRENDWAQLGTPSNWWVHQFSFIAKNVVVVGSDLELRSNSAGSAEINFNNTAIGAARYSVQATNVKFNKGVVVCEGFLYENGIGQEVDNEIVWSEATQTWRREYRIHCKAGEESWLFRDESRDPIGTHTTETVYIPGQYVEWFVDGQSVIRVNASDIHTGTPFPDRPLSLIADIWAGSWTHAYDQPEELTLTLHGYKVTPEA